MRFKKLRIMVGISIALFILIVGIIMLKAVAVNNASKHPVNANPPQARYAYYNGQIYEVQAPSQQQTPAKNPATQYHPTMMTGAS